MVEVLEQDTYYLYEQINQHVTKDEHISVVSQEINQNLNELIKVSVYQHELVGEKLQEVEINVQLTLNKVHNVNDMTTQKIDERNVSSVMN